MKVYEVQNSPDYAEDFQTYGIFSTRAKANRLAKFLNASREDLDGDSLVSYSSPAIVVACDVDVVNSYWIKKGFNV
jgi:hypothetical protein